MGKLGAKKCGRVIAEAGYLRRHQIERDRDGTPLCRWCKNPVPKKRRTFCSAECVHQHKLRSDVDYLRNEVEKKDNGVCAKCGRDCLKLLAEVRDRSRWSEEAAITSLRLLGYNRWRAEKAVLDGMALWDVDHLRPVVEGGGGCEIELIRSLCVPCHRQETKQLRQRLELGIPWDQLSIFDHAKEILDERESEK
jgi:5-methylcytosine-specific restriction enzyme A